MILILDKAPAPYCIPVAIIWGWCMCWRSELFMRSREGYCFATREISTKTTLVMTVHTLFHFVHDDVIKWKHFPRNWPFLRGIHRSPVNSPHKGQWRGALMFSLISVWINDWVNNREAGDLRRYRAHYDVNVMIRHNEPINDDQKDDFHAHIDIVPHSVFLHSGDDVTIDCPMWWISNWLGNCDART